MATNRHFTFIASLDSEYDVRVSLHSPVDTGTEVQLTRTQRNNRPDTQIFKKLVHMLDEDDLDTKPNPRAKLASLDDLQIRSLPCNAVFRKIQFQRGDAMYACVTVQHGGELCVVGNSDYQLLKFVQQGLVLSFQNLQNYDIRVTTEKRKKGMPFEDYDFEIIDLETIGKKVEKKLKRKADKIIRKRYLSGKNLSKIIRKSKAIEKIAATIAKLVGKAAAKKGARFVAKKIPIVSIFMGIYSGVERAKDGDFAGAFAEVASGAVANIPGVGTAVSAGLDLTLMSKDIADIVRKEQNTKKLEEHEIEELKEQNKAIREELERLLPESELYGVGGHDFFDESDRADVHDIMTIHVQCSKSIHGIMVEYRHGGCGTFHGGKGGKSHEFTIGVDERITKVEVSIDHGIISSLTFTTDWGKQETFGRTGQETYEFEMIDGAYLAAIKGYKSENILSAIGFIAKY